LQKPICKPVAMKYIGSMKLRIIKRAPSCK
jgi:hypothetical protein